MLNIAVPNNKMNRNLIAVFIKLNELKGVSTKEINRDYFFCGTTAIIYQVRSSASGAGGTTPS